MKLKKTSRFCVLDNLNIEAAQGMVVPLQVQNAMEKNVII